MTTQDRVTVEPNPVPMVEQAFTAPNFDPETQIAFDEAINADNVDITPVGDDTGEFTTVYLLNTDDVLSQSELQSLRSMMKSNLHSLNTYISELSGLQKYFYSKADVALKDVPHVHTAFECLNSTREALRQSKKELRKMESIQRKLRLAISYS